jgi:pilus assembly protein CpaC
VTTRLKQILATILTVSLSVVPFANAAEPAASAGTRTTTGQSAGSAQGQSPNDLFVTAGKSVVVTSDQPIDRVAVGFGDVAEAMAAGPKEVLVNAKAPGSTSLIVWQVGGGKLFFNVNVLQNNFLANSRLDRVRHELAQDLPGQNVSISADNGVVYLRGTAKDLGSVSRAALIASSLGKVVNLMYVDVPAQKAQILLKVRFASVDRSNSNQLALNLFSTGATNTIGLTSTQQYSAPVLPQNPQPNNATNPFVFTDLLNLFLFRKDINLGATIKDLETKGLLQVLAEPNVLAQDGKQASFLAGGEFPYPVLQGGSVGTGTGAVTIQFREFGVRLNFVPTITPRGTIRLQVAPEVSSLDFANGLVIQGFNIPALSTRKVRTEVELSEGQSFAISGLLDRRVTETLEKMPFIGDIPVLGKLFQSRSLNKQNTELLVIVTPEFVRPMPAGSPPLDLQYPKPFMGPNTESAVRTPGIAATGPVPVTPPGKSIPFEKLLQSIQSEKEKQLVPNAGTVKENPYTGEQQEMPAETPQNQAPAPPPNPQ